MRCIDTSSQGNRLGKQGDGLDALAVEARRREGFILIESLLTVNSRLRALSERVHDLTSIPAGTEYGTHATDSWPSGSSLSWQRIPGSSHRPFAC